MATSLLIASPAIAAPPYWDSAETSTVGTATVGSTFLVGPASSQRSEPFPLTEPVGVLADQRQREASRGEKPVLPPPPDPALHLWLGETWLGFPIDASSFIEAASSVPIDVDRGFSRSDWSTQLRVGATFDSRLAFVPLLLAAEVEGEFQLRTLTTDSMPEGDGYPSAPDSTKTLRKAWARGSLGPYLHLGGGLMTSTFGMGLLANDGTRPADPSLFSEPRDGDRTLRGFLATGPVTRAKIFASVAVDSVVADDVLLGGDAATQLVFAFIAGRREPTWAGLYVVRRVLTAGDGDETMVWVVDVAGRLELRPTDGWVLSIESELAMILGRTDFAATAELPRHDVRQLGGVVRALLDAGRLGAGLDVVAASGDGNLDDDVQSAFKADPRFAEGLLLFRHVLAARTARAAYRATDPDLLGYPPEDLERLPTRGSVSNTLAFFPRAFYRPSHFFELYGGPLFAVALEPLVDPLATRLGGGSPRALNGKAPDGEYLGTELDLGFRVRFPFEGGEVAAVGEGGVLFPGGALSAGGSLARTVHGGRLIVRVTL